jgi:hypothetical protein
MAVESGRSGRWRPSGGEKNLKQYFRNATAGPPYTPHPMHECQNKGLVKWAICKHMKTKRLLFARKKWAICKCMKRKSEDFRPTGVIEAAGKHIRKPQILIDKHR